MSKTRYATFSNFQLSNKRIVFLFNLFNETLLKAKECIFFELSEPFIPHNDLIAYACSTLCGQNFDMIEFDLPITKEAQENLAIFTKAEIKAPLLDNSKARQVALDKTETILNFSGGFDSLAALAVMPTNTKLVSIDFGGWFERETDFFKKFNPYIVKTNFRKKKFDRNSWTYMGVGAILFADYLNAKYNVFGTILEANISQLELLPPTALNKNTFPFSFANLEDVRYLNGITEFGTAKIVAHYFPEKLHYSLHSLAAVGSEKLYRKWLLIDIVCKMKNIKNILFPPSLPKEKTAFGSYFATDFLIILFLKHYKIEEVNKAYSTIPMEAIHLSKLLSLAFYEKLHPAFSKTIPKNNQEEYLSKLDKAGITPYDEKDFIELLLVSQYLARTYDSAKTEKKNPPLLSLHLYIASTDFLVQIEKIKELIDHMNAIYPKNDIALLCYTNINNLTITLLTDTSEAIHWIPVANFSSKSEQMQNILSLASKLNHSEYYLFTDTCPNFSLMQTVMNNIDTYMYRNSISFLFKNLTCEGAFKYEEKKLSPHSFYSTHYESLFSNHLVMNSAYLIPYSLIDKSSNYLNLKRNYDFSIENTPLNALPTEYYLKDKIFERLYCDDAINFSLYKKDSLKALDTLSESYQELEKRLSVSQKSISFKVGRLITFFPRQVRNTLKRAKTLLQSTDKAKLLSLQANIKYLEESLRNLEEKHRQLTNQYQKDFSGQKIVNKSVERLFASQQVINDSINNQFSSQQLINETVNNHIKAQQKTNETNKEQFSSATAQINKSKTSFEALEKKLETLKKKTTSDQSSLTAFINYRYRQSLNPSQYEDALIEWYEHRMGEKLNLYPPKTFNEKIQWIKLYGVTPLMKQLADKYAMRSWVAEKIGEEYLVPLIGVWDNPKEINFSALPEQFVLKANHGSAYNLIVHDKAVLNIEQTLAICNNWLSKDYAFVGGFEMQYHNMPKKIIAELLLTNNSHEIEDYKVWCFNGKPQYISVISERSTGGRHSIFDLDWNIMPFTYAYPKHDHLVPRPNSLSRLLSLAEALSANFPHVRVDFYSLSSGEIYVGELTFTSASGTAKWNLPEGNNIFGDLLLLPDTICNKENI